jgi:hypothetical protein
MSTNRPQSLERHASTDRWYLALAFVAVVNCVVTIVALFHRPGGVGLVWEIGVSAAIVILALRVRQYPLKVQDRVIRLEERLRLQALAPPEWHGNILRLSEDQLIGLRFASDEEVVTLARQALAEGLNRKQIKQRIRQWRPDNWRV